MAITVKIPKNKNNDKCLNYFIVGSRYRNRLGWYEVLEIEQNRMRIRHEINEKIEWVDSLDILERISKNIENEQHGLMPCKDDSDNAAFFFTMGYLVDNCVIEAIIPPKSKEGFDNNYRKIKGVSPVIGQDGYYIHNLDNVDKWGTEMRLTFKLPTKSPCPLLFFGKNYHIVKSPIQAENRINSNELCFNLLHRGFSLGKKQNRSVILGNLPQKFIDDFNKGCCAG